MLTCGQVFDRDHKAQTAVAAALFGGQVVWIAKTVVLETVRVLGDACGFEAYAIREALIKQWDLITYRSKTHKRYRRLSRWRSTESPLRIPCI